MQTTRLAGWLWVLALAVNGACGSEKALSPEEAKQKSQQQLEALSVPGRSLGVEAFTDNNSLSVMAPAVFPEVATLLQLGPNGADPLVAALTDAKLNGSEDGDRVRALAAFALEKMGAANAATALRTYLTAATAPVAAGAAAPPLPFFSIQTAAHALAVLSGQTGQIKSLYDAADVQALLGPPTAAHVINTAKGNPIEHKHLIGTMPPAWWTADFEPAVVKNRNDIFTMKLDGIAAFEDPILLLEDATRSYDCHSWTFRRDDTRLPSLTERYHVLGESVPTLLKDEGYTDITASPSLWKPTDVVVFYKQNGETPTHTGRLSSGGKSIMDPELRFTSKWSITLPVVNVSVRDCTKLYGQVVRIWSKVEQCAVEVRAAQQSTCARRSDGTVWCWGLNDSGQLGNGTTADSTTPVQVQGLTGATSLATGVSFACAVGAGGAVWCWGGNFASGLGNGGTTDSPTPVQVAGLTGAVQVVAATNGACVRKADGTVWCWGGSFGPTLLQIKTAGPRPNPTPKPLVADDLSAGQGGFSAHVADGGLWGWNESRGDFPGSGGSDWGFDEVIPPYAAYPVTTVMTSLFMPPMLFTGGLRAPVVGRLHACVPLAGGLVWCWGVNDNGQLGHPTPDLLYTYPAAVAGLGPVIDLAAGDDHVCARTQDGAVWCWGEMESMMSEKPVAIAGLTPVTETAGFNLTAGADHSCALATDGLWCWGSNLFGQLGTTTEGTRTQKPVRAALPCP